MPARIRGGLVVICAFLTVAQFAHAQKPTFADLLDRAKAEAAAGHRWAPPGDNVTETVLGMMDLMATATPAELAELSKLLESDKMAPPPMASNSAHMTEEPASQAAPAPVPSTSQAPPPVASATPAPAPSLPEPRGPVAPIHDAPSLATSNPGTASARAANPGKLSLLTPSPVTPSPVTPNLMTPSLVTPQTTGRAAVLFARGLDAERRGDVSGARRYYSAAAQQDDAAAARNLGRLYDPAYLGKIAFGGIDPDPALARRWYERAVMLGDTEAGPLLEAMSTR